MSLFSRKMPYKTLFFFLFVTLTACGGGGNTENKNSLPPSTTSLQEIPLHIEENLYVAAGLEGKIFTSTNAIDWTERTNNSNEDIKGLTRGNAISVAVGKNGTILTSTNNIDWLSQNSNTASKLKSITWHNNMFVAVGDNGTIVTSPNGIDWTHAISSTTNNLIKVIWSNDRFIVIGEGKEFGTVLTSSNGIDWTNHIQGELDHIRSILLDIAWNGSVYVAVGWWKLKNCLSCGMSPLVQTSPDGKSWTQASLPDSILTSSLSLISINWNDQKFIVHGNWAQFGEQGEVFATSDNGKTWHAEKSNTWHGFSQIVNHDENWYAVTLEGNLYISQDGKSWDEYATINASIHTLFVSTLPELSIVDAPFYYTPSTQHTHGSELTFNIQNKPNWLNFDTQTGTLWGTPSNVDVGITKAISITVTDGESSSTLPPFDLRATQGKDLAPVITGTPDNTVTHSSSYSFTPTASDGNDDILTFSIINKPRWATFNNSTGILSGTPGQEDVGHYQNIYIKATDGIETVSLAPFGITVTNTPPFIGIGHWIAAGDSGIHTSQDGKTWHSDYEVDVSLPFPPLELKKLTRTNTNYIAIEEGDKTLTSLDSFNWTLHSTNDTRTSFSDITSNNDLLVAVGKNYVFNIEGEPRSGGTYHNAVFTSNDGINWTDYNIDDIGNISSISWNGSMYVALGYESIDSTAYVKTFTSTDLTNWNTYTTSINGIINDIIWDGSQYIAVGDRLVISSNDGIDWSVNYRLEDTNTRLEKISWNGSNYVTVGVESVRASFGPRLVGYILNAVILTSEDAIFWERISLPTKDICFEISLNIPNQENEPSYSCHPQTLPSGLTAIYWNGLEFLAMGETDVARSTDGINWVTMKDASPGNIKDIISSDQTTTEVQISVNQAYTIAPHANDPESDALTFYVEGLPAWANFNNETGLLSGTPKAEHIGTTNYVDISVSDGYDNSPLPTFKIEIVE